MKKGLILIGVGLVVLGVSGYFIFSKVLNKPAKAALQIASTPDSKVFLNGEEVGVTPYFDDSLEVGEYTVKLTPQDGSSLASWEERVSLVANIVTSVNYQLGTSEELISGEILALEKIGNPKNAALAVVSQPDGALIKIDNESQGFAPVSLEELSPSEHQITISSPGFAEKTITAQTIAGYKLMVTVKLAQEDLSGMAEATSEAEEEEKTEEEEKEEKEEPTAAPIDLEKPYVKILTTPTGWLRVRMGPITTATEAAKVKPGQAFPYLSEEENGWYKIEYEDGEEGWVSGVYSELIE